MAEADTPPRRCEAPTTKGNPCINRALPGADVCAVHSGNPELKHQFMSQLSAKSSAARAARKDTDLEELLAACDFSTPEDINTFLTAIARFSIEKNDPRFLNGAARLVETSRVFVELKKYKEEALAWRKRFGAERPPSDD